MLLLLIVHHDFDIATDLPHARLVIEHRPAIKVIDVATELSGNPEQIMELNGIRLIIFVNNKRLITTLGDPLVLDTLNAEERLFVRGWYTGQINQPMNRLGEGLSWDSTGFEAP